MRLPRMSIRAKLIASFAVPVVLMIVLGAVAISRLSTENSHVDRLARNVVPATSSVGAATALMNKYRKDELHYILATPSDRAGADGVSGALAGALTDMAATLRGYRADGFIADQTDAR